MGILPVIPLFMLHNPPFFYRDLYRLAENTGLEPPRFSQMKMWENLGPPDPDLEENNKTYFGKFWFDVKPENPISSITKWSFFKTMLNLLEASKNGVVNFTKTNGVFFQTMLNLFKAVNFLSFVKQENE